MAKLRTLLIIILFVFAILPALIIGIISINASKDTIKEQIYDHLKTTAQSRSDHIESSLEEQKEKVELIKNMPAFPIFLKLSETDDDYIEWQERINGILDTAIHEDFIEVFILNKDGKIIKSTSKEHVGLDKSTDSYFIYGKEKTYIKDFYYSETFGKNLFTISSPILDENSKELLGVLVVRIDKIDINEITLDRTGLGETGETYLINQDGFMITDSRFSEESTVLTQKVDTQGSKHCFGHAEEEHIAFVYPDYRGITILGAHTNIEETDWCLLAEIDAEEVFAPLKALQFKIIIMGLLFFLLMFFITWIFADTLSRPIQKLSESAKKIKQGNLNIKCEVKSKDEIGELAQTFDEMRLGLKDRNQLLNSLLISFKGKFGNLATILVRKDVQELVKKNPRIEKILPKSLGISITKAKELQRESKKKRIKNEKNL